MLKKICVMIVVVMLLLTFSACSNQKYNVSKINKLFESEGVEKPAYYENGSVAYICLDIVLVDEHTEKGNLYVLLSRVPYESSNYKYGYQLIVQVNDNTIVDGYVTMLQFTYSLYDNPDLQYASALAYVKCRKTTDNEQITHIQRAYRLYNFVLNDGQYVECEFRSMTIAGNESDANFVLPQEDNWYFESLIAQGMDVATQYLREKNVPLFYEVQAIGYQE